MTPRTPDSPRWATITTRTSDVMSDGVVCRASEPVVRSCIAYGRGPRSKSSVASELKFTRRTRPPSRRM